METERREQHDWEERQYELEKKEERDRKNPLASIGNLGAYRNYGQMKEPAAPNGNLGAYHNYEQVVDELKKKEKEHPDIISVSSIGETLEGRPIEMVRITGGPEKKKGRQKKPEVLILGQTHAREYISAEVALGLVNTLADKYGKDDEITKLVDERDFYVVPVVNPDGSMRVAQEMATRGDSRWRKNARDSNRDGRLDAGEGVDLNRNFGYPLYRRIMKKNAGASTNPLAEDYRGTKPFSEPETAAIRDLVKKHDFSVSISYHSYSGLILYPLGDTKRPTKDAPVLRKLAENMRDVQPHEKYKVQQSYELYPTVGGSDEWLYRKGNMMPFTFEVYKGRSDLLGGAAGGIFDRFNPPEEEIQHHVENNVPSALYLASVADNPRQVVSTRERLTTYAKDLARYEDGVMKDDASRLKKYSGREWKELRDHASGYVARIKGKIHHGGGPKG